MRVHIVSVVIIFVCSDCRGRPVLGLTLHYFVDQDLKCRNLALVHAPKVGLRSCVINDTFDLYLLSLLDCRWSLIEAIAIVVIDSARLACEARQQCGNRAVVGVVDRK
jgi:hypothetical protein